MVGKSQQATAAQQKRMDAISRMRCIACDIADQRQPNSTEVHHLVDKGNRRASGGHDATIPLCAWHHRGVPSLRVTGGDMAVQYGPSLALQKRAFVAEYGSERELLLHVNNRIEVPREQVAHGRPAPGPTEVVVRQKG